MGEPHESARLAVLVEGGDATALRLATELGLPATGPGDTGASHLLAFCEGRLELRWNRPGAPGPVAVDLVRGSRRSVHREQPLARAIGLHREVRSVVDATAGLGRDAFDLACLGCRVLAVERSPVIAALLRDGLRRAAADPATAERLGGRLVLRGGDARSLLASLAGAERPDAVYLDPMFPDRTKAARVKKEMQLFHELLGSDSGAEELFEAAAAAARRRVVVKRPLRAPPLVEARPAVVVRGTRVRWDVYT